MKTKELREKFAKAVLDGRFDNILDEHMNKPVVERQEDFEIALNILTKCLECDECDDKTKAFLSEFGFAPHIVGHTRYNTWKVQQGRRLVTLSIEEECI